MPGSIPGMTSLWHDSSRAGASIAAEVCSLPLKGPSRGGRQMELVLTPSQTISILRYRWTASSRAAEIIRDRPQLAITAPQRRNSFLNLTFDTATIGSEAHAVIWMGGGASHGHRGAVVPRRGSGELFGLHRNGGLARVHAELAVKGSQNKWDEPVCSGCSRAGRTGFSSATLSRARSGRIYSLPPAEWGWKA